MGMATCKESIEEGIGGIMSGVIEKIREEEEKKIIDWIEERQVRVDHVEWRIWTVYDKGMEFNRLMEEIEERQEKLMLLGGNMNE